QSPGFALRAVEILKETRAGQMSFLQAPGAEVPAHESIQAPGIAGRLVDMLEIDPRYAPLAEMVLGNVMLAEDLSAALSASNLNGHGTLFVTRDGDLLAPGRVIRGGSAGAPVRNDDLAGRESATAELRSAEEQHHAAADAFAAGRAAREQAETALHALRLRAREAERLVAERHAGLARSEQATALAAAQISGARRRLGEIDELCAASNARLEELALAEQDSRARLAAIRVEHETCRTAAERAGASMLEATARVEARKAELAALEREYNHAVETANHLEAQLEENCRSLVRSNEERAAFERELTVLGAQDENARAREGELGEAVARLREECGAREAELEAARAELKCAREQLATLETEANECALRRERARTLAEELARGFAEKFAVEFDAAAEELVAALAGRVADQDEARLLELRARAGRIGEVNLAAESEVQELEERGGTLGREKADLETALADLTRTITQLNREARKRFHATFEGAAANFAELFPKLMRGGKGKLELIEASDVLEAGVNILVQPAGKKVKEIGLLSGGEKALSAMALVFSLFLLNPSPFCVMDEVDAPLDEFSLARFTELLGDLKQRSQFIVITHNQRTMQRADQIHGVTMDRPGISKIISLKIPHAA
ncbi:MAG TPA: hypothetical protein VEJ86_04150, partial [Candidatus Binataceae bacterium]|nr:hypothetical protein [Candidatus Binataceae bacterium]